MSNHMMYVGRELPRPPELRAGDMCALDTDEGFQIRTWDGADWVPVTPALPSEPDEKMTRADWWVLAISAVVIALFWVALLAGWFRVPLG